MDYMMWMNEAISKTGSLKNNIVFHLKDLFDDDKWSSLSKGERQNFGKYFKNEVKEGHVPNVNFLVEETKNGSAKYKKEVMN